mgnify:CR=1 FL=1
MDNEKLQSLTEGTPLIYAGNRVTRVPAAVAGAFRPGDSIAVVQTDGTILHMPAADRQVADDAVARATRAFERLNSVDDASISRFFDLFAARLEDDSRWALVQQANDLDVADAQARGRSTTRLLANDTLRESMAAGLRGWVDAPSRRGRLLETVEHEGWRAELVGAALGVVGFVFEGRPNVLADATGVLRGGNTVVFRIGRDALRTARAIMTHALDPALEEAGLPDGSVVLVESAAHAAGWALFSNAGLALAVARGSGPAVAQLGALAQQAGVPVSLHGTGGAWIVADEDATPGALSDAVTRSLDRKVCNTLNTCCVPRARVDTLVPALLEGLEAAGARLGQRYKLHVLEGSVPHVPADLFECQVDVTRAGGVVRESQAQPIEESALGHEWEWEQTPEITLVVVESTAHAVDLFNRHSPRFVASLISSDEARQQRFFEGIDAPFVGDSYTRWVDGQFALHRPELGLSNWQWGRLFGRGGILSGDSVYTVRTRARQES